MRALTSWLYPQKSIAWSLRLANIIIACFVVPIAAPSVDAADLMVAGASSLTNAFTEIGKAYEKTDPGVRVLFTFAASGQLVQQISRGAPVDVLATADLESMDRADQQRLIYRDSRASFAANKLWLVTPADSTLSLSQLQDLGNAKLERIAIGTPESVPVGRYAKLALEKAGLWEQLKPKYVYAQNVRQSLDYVIRGEVDAGFVYASDAAISPVKIRTALEVPLDKPILYPIAAIKGFGQEKRARSFIAFVRSSTGQAILQKYGFLTP
jgi:molybdate transport system substrate-binding protein